MKKRIQQFKIIQVTQIYRNNMVFTLRNLKMATILDKW